MNGRIVVSSLLEAPIEAGGWSFPSLVVVDAVVEFAVDATDLSSADTLGALQAFVRLSGEANCGALLPSFADSPVGLEASSETDLFLGGKLRRLCSFLSRDF